ncbi:MAG: CRISPR-associated endonuclease Cas1 [Verrucomicrobiota bacterium]
MHLAAVVRQVFAAKGVEAGAVEATAPSPTPVEDRFDVPPVEVVLVPDAELETSEVDNDAPKVEQQMEPLPARMLNEFVYCPRLFYYEHVEGVFVESADTIKGAALHARVDKGKGGMRKPEGGDLKPESETDGAGPDTIDNPKSKVENHEIHSRSVMLGSERLGVVAKMDLVEATLNDAGTLASVCPVDYKAGSPQEGPAGLGLWDTDRMQLGLQCLILRDNGYVCDAGIIYYRGTKQRVRLEITPDLEGWVRRQIAAARIVAAGPIPPPLVDSPKCTRCSLAPVCLPDETHWLASRAVESSELSVERDETEGPSTINSQPPTFSSPRRLIAPRDDKRALYLNTPGYHVGCHDGVLKVKEGRATAKQSKQSANSGAGEGDPASPAGGGRVVEEVRVSDVCHVALFGNIQISTQAVQRLCDSEIPLTFFSMGGWFYGMTRGHSLKNVLLRIEQFRHAADPASCLRLAKQFVRGKIHNHRVLFMRNHVEPPEHTKLRLGKAREDALAAASLGELLGIEGAAAAVYFQKFGGLLREQAEDDFLEGIAQPVKSTPDCFTFDFTTRNRRPPTDPVNALLSLAYSLLAKECTLAACAVGFDPYVGFYHQPRHGRPALALDLMEEFRPLIAESAVLTAINNRFVSTGDFVSAGRAVNLSPAGRKQFFLCFEQRMNSLITHPVFDYKVSYRRALELQFRILARVLTGEIPEYIPFLTR